MDELRKRDRERQRGREREDGAKIKDIRREKWGKDEDEGW